MNPLPKECSTRLKDEIFREREADNLQDLTSRFLPLQERYRTLNILWLSFNPDLIGVRRIL
jgi:hypothetical protein